MRLIKFIANMLLFTYWATSFAFYIAESYTPSRFIVSVMFILLILNTMRWIVEDLGES